MGAAGNKKPKGMHKKHAPAYQVEEAIHENDLKKGKKTLIPQHYYKIFFLST